MTTAALPAAPALLSASEFLRLHGGECGVDLVKGRIAREPMPTPEHGRICFRAALLLNAFIEPRDLGRIMTNDSFVFTRRTPDSVRGADVCFISHARLPKDQPLPNGPLETPPELVVEVRSASDRLRNILDKIDDYLEAGVDVVILLEPAAAFATLFRKGSEQQLAAEDELTLPDILPGFSDPVRRFFE